MNPSYHAYPFSAFLTYLERIHLEPLISDPSRLNVTKYHKFIDELLEMDIGEEYQSFLDLDYDNYNQVRLWVKLHKPPRKSRRINL